MDSSAKVDIRAKLKTFPGGIHPHEFGDGKAATASKPSKPANAPKYVAISMSQHIGAPCECTVKPGERVLKGQRIGEPKGFMGAPVHASVSGKVKAIEQRAMANGMNAQCVIIENDMLDEWDASIVPPDNAAGMTHSELIDYIREKGIVGLGGAAFPTSIKLSPPSDKPIDYVIINGAECEPFLTSDHRMMLEHPNDILDGLGWAMKITGAKHGVIAIEENKLDAIAAMQKLVEGTPYKVVPLKAKYPQGGEKQLIQAVTASEIPSERLVMWWPWYRRADKKALIAQRRAEAEARGEEFHEPSNRFVKKTGELLGKAKDGVVNAASKIGKKDAEPAAPQYDEGGNPIPPAAKEPNKFIEKTGELLGKAKDGVVNAASKIGKKDAEPAAPQYDEGGNLLPPAAKEPNKFIEKTGELFGKAKDGVVNAASKIGKKDAEPAAPQYDEGGNLLPPAAKEPNKFVEKTGELFGKAKDGVVNAASKIGKKDAEPAAPQYDEGGNLLPPAAKEPNKFVEKTGELFGKAKDGVTGLISKLEHKDGDSAEETADTSEQRSTEWWNKANTDLNELSRNVDSEQNDAPIAQPDSNEINNDNNDVDIWSKARENVADRIEESLPEVESATSEEPTSKAQLSEKASGLWGKAKGGLMKFGEKLGLSYEEKIADTKQSAASEVEDSAQKHDRIGEVGDKLKDIGGSVGGWLGGLKDKATDMVDNIRHKDEPEASHADETTAADESSFAESDISAAKQYAEQIDDTIAEEMPMTPVTDFEPIESAREDAEQYADELADSLESDSEPAEYEDSEALKPPYGKTTGYHSIKKKNRNFGKGDEQLPDGDDDDEAEDALFKQAVERAMARTDSAEHSATAATEPAKSARFKSSNAVNSAKKVLGGLKTKVVSLGKSARAAKEPKAATKPDAAGDTATAPGSDFADKAKALAGKAGRGLAKAGKKTGKVLSEKGKSAYAATKTKLSFKYDDDGNVDTRPYFQRMFSHMHKLNEIMCDGRQVPSGKLPMDAGCVVLNVSTAASIARAMRTGQPITERVVTVTGDVTFPANLRAPIGTPVSELIEQCGGLSSDVEKVIAGGPMMGQALADLSTPVVKATGGVLVVAREHAPATIESNCIRCGKCVEACPAKLLPQRLNELAMHDRFEQCGGLHALDCIECGSCSYVCPAKRNLAQSIKMAKREIVKRRNAK